MSSVSGILLLIGVLLVELVPMIVTLLLVWDTGKMSKGQKWIAFLVAGGCVLAQLAAFIMLHKYLLGHGDMAQTARRIMTFDFTCQDIDKWPVSVIVLLGLGLGMGFGVRFLLFRKGKNGYPALAVRRVATLLILLVTVGIVSVCTLYYGLTGMERVVINEVGGNNHYIKKGTTQDYVELHNTGKLDCMIHGLYLTDDPTDLQKHPIPSARIPAGGYLTVMLSENTMGIKKEGGETVILSDSRGKLLDQMQTRAMTVPDQACARTASGEWKILSGTPGWDNEAQLTLPESGFYEEEFYLEIPVPAGATVYYTLDGSLPTTQAAVYTEPIRVYNRSEEANVFRSVQNVVEQWHKHTPSKTPVDKAFIVRAMAVGADGASGAPVTATYFVDMQDYREGGVISLVADPEDLFGPNGIYVTGSAYDNWYNGDRKDAAPRKNYTQRGREWERAVTMCYLSPELSFQQEAGLRVAGGSSRDRVLKCFGLYARNSYGGSSTFDQNVFSGIESEKLSIRGGYANSVCQQLVPDRAFATQSQKRVAVFLNGEFWYNANILEKYDERYFEEHYGVDADNVVVAEKGVTDPEQPEQAEMLAQIYQYIERHNMASPEAYQGFGEIVDIQSYIDYMCFNVYIDNMDYTEKKNSVWWRSVEKTDQPYEDGKWRFCLYDLDAMEWGDPGMFGVQTQAQKNSFSLIPRYTAGQAINQQPIYVALKKNDLFRRQFVLTFMDMVNTNFQYENVQKVLDAYGTDTTDYLPGNGGTRSAAYYAEFFKTRAQYIVPFLGKEFGLTGTVQALTLSVNDSQGGKIQLNTVTPDLTQGTWTGQYYTDYPVTLTAIPNPGYRFVGWEGDCRDTAASVNVTIQEGGTQLRGVFEKVD